MFTGIFQPTSKPFLLGCQEVQYAEVLDVVSFYSWKAFVSAIEFVFLNSECNPSHIHTSVPS